MLAQSRTRKLIADYLDVGRKPNHPVALLKLPALGVVVIADHEFARQIARVKINPFQVGEPRLPDLDLLPIILTSGVFAGAVRKVWMSKSDTHGGADYRGGEAGGMMGKSACLVYRASPGVQVT